MQKNSAIFLWLIVVGTVASIGAMDGPRRGEVKRRPVSMVAFGIRKKVPQPPSKSPETPSTIQFANGHPPKVSQPKDDIFGPLPPPPEGYDFREARSSNQPPLFGNRPWQLEEQPYAMASDVCPKEEEEPPSLRKTISDKGSTKSKRRVSRAVKGTLRDGLKRASSSLQRRHEPPSDEKKPVKRPSQTKFKVIPFSPQRQAPTATYSNANLVQPEKEGGAYGNVPEDFTRQLRNLMQEATPSIPEAMRLIGNGADPCTQDEKGNTMLHLLAREGNEGGITYLLERKDRGLDPNTTNASGETPFMSAFYAQNFGAATELLKYGATTPSEVDSQGNSLLHVSASKGSKCLTEQLLAAKATDMNSQNGTGQTPLHCAILHNNAGIAIWLIRSNAALLPDQHGKEPLDYAVSRGSRPIIAALLQRDEYPLEMRQRLAQKTRNERIRKLLLQTRTQTPEPVYAELGEFKEKST